MKTTDYHRLHKATRSREEEPEGRRRKNPALGTIPHPQALGDVLGVRAGEGSVVEESDREEGKKKYTKHPTALSP